MTQPQLDTKIAEDISIHKLSNVEIVEDVYTSKHALSLISHTEKNRAKELLENFVDAALDGTVTWNKNISVSIQSAISKIDDLISQQLSAILHHEEFQKLEGAWRGLNYLVSNTETSTNLKVRVMNASKRDISKDLTRAAQFDQSHLFKSIYESEFGTAGGEPYGVLIGDYEFTNHPEDIDLLSGISQVAAASFCPFVASAGSEMFALDGFEDLVKPIDLAKTFDAVEYAKWKSFRNSDDARFVTLTMPRVLARSPYGKESKAIEEFNFEEFRKDPNTGTSPTPNNKNFCWMNASYVLGARITDAFAKYGWCIAIRGAEGGGKVNDLPLYTFKSEGGDTAMLCPTEVSITDRRESELSQLGFLPLCHYKNTDYAVFFGGQSSQKPAVYSNPDSTSNAAISARLPYIMATSRVAHYLKVMARDKIGSYSSPQEMELWLNNWLLNYVNSNQTSDLTAMAKRPLAEAKVTVEEIPGRPGSYHAVAWLRPWLQLEELTTSLRMVARIPQKGGS